MSSEGNSTAGVGCVVVVVVLLLVGWALPDKADSKKKLTDDDRIERLEREQRELIELNEWQQKKLRADEWDRQRGR